jgi:hypothetical protein
MGLMNEERCRRELERMEKAKAEYDARFWWRAGRPMLAHEQERGNDRLV